MDIKQIINFITIVEEGNITKAAQKLHISQPPLSNQLKALEEELGVKLIERGSRKVTLTDVGNLLYKRGKDMVNVFESTLIEVEDFKSGIEGVLKIGAVSTCNQFIPNELISPYAKQYPKVKFELYEGNTYEVVLADSIARYKRFEGYDVFFQTRTDEHGQKIELKAEEAGVTPKEFVDNAADQIKKIWELMDTS